MRKLQGLIPIFIYIIVLIIINVWYMSYYRTPMALDIGALYYIPYVFGGSFILCLIQGILVRKINGNGHVAMMIIYAAILVLGAYMIIWLDEAFMRSYPDLINFYKQELPLSYGFSRVDTPLILAETSLGFIMGWLIRNRKAKRLEVFI